MNRGRRLSFHIQKDLLLWFFFFCSFVAYRAAFIFYFRDKIDAVSSISDVFWIITIGFRYDSMSATFWTLFPLLISIGSFFFAIEKHANRIRIIWGGIFSFFYASACVISKYYFEEFNNQFDRFIVNFYYDDTTAILRTIWSGYHLIRILVIISVIACISILIVRWMLARNFGTARSRTLISLLIIICAVAGTSVLFEQHRDVWNDTVITNDDFLNKAVLNPFAAIFYTIKDFKETDNVEGLHKFIPDNDVKGAVHVVFPNKSESDNLDEYLKKYASGTVNPPPRHVFLIVMESYDLWPLTDKYESLHLSDCLKQLAHEGILVRHFLSAANNSGESLFSIITGLPFGGLSINYSTQKYPSSIAETFSRLGYKTNLFYGGDLRWQNLAGFAPAQGFTAAYGSNHMVGKTYTNEWGIPDEYLFDFVLSKIDDSQPSFNLIFTTSNHPPYSIDVVGKGFPLKNVPADFGNQNPDTLKILGHHWYSDQCMGSFVRKAEHRLHSVLVAVTGDHPSHRIMLQKKRNFYETNDPLCSLRQECPEWDSSRP